MSCTGPIFEGYGARIAKDQFDITKETPGFAAKLAMKDVRHIRDLAKDSKARPALKSGLAGQAGVTQASPA
jgi:3-hydroxyisobutyrate dehydrogenase-like beta-hydroxyacid dehydrogenase